MIKFLLVNNKLILILILMESNLTQEEAIDKFYRDKGIHKKW
jgi:hypothetical protein